MRILIVHNILWAHYKSSVFQALQQLADRQENTTVKVLQIARNERSRASLDTADDANAPSYRYNYDLLFDRFLEDINLAERSRAILRSARAFKPDVITITGYYDPAQILLLLWAKLQGIQVVMQNESTETDHQRGGLKERLKRWIFDQCDGFFCFGTQSANYLIKLGVRPDRILLRKSAVDNNALQSAYERALPTRSNEQHRLAVRPNNFIFIGRLIAYKNLTTLITAFAEVQSQVPQSVDWGLILLGEGPEYEPLQQQIDTLGLTGKVRFLAGRPWYKVPDVLALSDVLVLPSLSEPWGLVVNEAMVCGLPIIVSNRCGCAYDLVDDTKNGFIFDPLKPAELTALLLRFMNGDVDRQKMQQSSQEIISSYSPEAVAQDMLDGYTKISRL